MAKKKDEKDVLVVRDEKTGEISVVAGLNADGTPKRTPAKAENAQSFLQFDRHGDVLDNFFKNFFRQCKEPSRFGFYRIAADQVDSMLGVMKDLLQHPYQNKQILAPHKIDTFPYQQQVMEEQAAQQTEKQEPQKQENMEQQKEQQQDNSEQTQGKRGYRPIDESKINWQELEDRWGVKRDDLEKSGDLTKMLHYGKSDLVKVKPTFGGESFELDARLSFKKDGEGNVSLVPHFIRKEQKLDEYKEHKFSDNDRKNLRETGNLGRVVDIVDRETGEIIPSYISIDRKTNEITDIPASKVRIPERIGKTEITAQERDMLRAGLPVRDKLIERNDGRKFVTTLQVNVEQRGVEFVPGTGKSPRTAQTQETKGDTSKNQAQGGENADQTKKEQRRNTWCSVLFQLFHRLLGQLGHFLGSFCLGSFLLAGLSDTGKALGHILDAVVDILLDIGQRGNSFLQGSLDLIQRLHNILLDLLRSSAGVLFQFTQHLADLLCVDGQLIRADEHERHDHDDDKFPKTNFHTNSFPFLCGGTFSGADASALQWVPRTHSLPCSSSASVGVRRSLRLCCPTYTEKW